MATKQPGKNHGYSPGGVPYSVGVRLRAHILNMADTEAHPLFFTSQIRMKNSCELR